MAQRPPVRVTPQQIAAMARARGLDPQAVLAVFKQEGLGGGIGDSGHAFGPSQLNDAGGVLTGKFPGWSTQQKQDWAWSPSGVDYALGGIQKVAGGQQGEQAVRSIVSRFERPADIPGEIARALAGFGGGTSQASVGGGTLTPAAAPAPPQQNFSAQLAGSTGTDEFLQALYARHRARAAQPQTAATPTLGPSPTASPAAPATGGGLAELLHEGLGGPTHSTGEHIHAAWTNPQQELAAIRQAQALGLNVRENPYTDPVDPVHAKNSFHIRNFAGKYNGRTLGQAFDASGSPEAMRRLYALLAKQR